LYVQGTWSSYEADSSVAVKARAESFAAAGEEGMKVVFLDIDGVLNSTEYIEGLEDPRIHENHIDPARVVLLNQLLDESTYIVISSSWRSFVPDRMVLSKLLEERGLLAGKVIDYTPYVPLRFNNFRREDEITAWLSSHVVESYVILEDAELFQNLEKRVVRPEDGIDQSHIEEAKRVLNEGIE
jgi:hypothetical protein